MRWCSRATAGGIPESACSAGAASEACGGTVGCDAVQAASSSTATATPAATSTWQNRKLARSPRFTALPKSLAQITSAGHLRSSPPIAYPQSVAVSRLDLLRPHGLDPRNVAAHTTRLDKAADRDTPAGETLRIETHCHKITLVSLRDRNRKAL